MSERQLQAATFWVRHRLLLRNLGYGTLIAIGAIVILGIVLSLVPLPVRRARPSLTP